jgi:hypothetical protein
MRLILSGRQAIPAKVRIKAARHAHKKGKSAAMHRKIHKLAYN